MTDQTKLAVVEEQVKELRKAIDQMRKESQEFHTEMRVKMDHIEKDSVRIVRLEEKMKVVDKILWSVIGVVIALSAQAIFDLFKTRG